MGIIRVKKEKEYVSIANAMLQNKNLSWEARGIMAYLLSKPDGWECRNYDLVNQGPASDHVIRRVLKELQEAGYIHRYRKSEGRGKIEWITEIYETPELNTALRNGTFSNIENIETESFDLEKSVDIVSTDSSKYLPLENTDIILKNSQNLTTDPTIKEPSILTAENSLTPEKKADLNTLVPFIANIPNNPITTTDELKAITLFGYEVALFAQLDISTIGASELKALAAQTIKLHAKVNIAAKWSAFKKWWATSYWLGKQGQPPTIKQIGTTWGQFEGAKVGPPTNGAGPVLNNAEKARLAELVAENE